jgi:hypothetical protein
MSAHAAAEVRRNSAAREQTLMVEDAIKGIVTARPAMPPS